MKRDVAVYSDDGIKLAAVLYTPDAAEGPVPGVVVCQGFGSTKEINLPPIAEALADAGYAALIFDYRGFGQSGGTPWRLIPEEQIADIRACTSFLEGEDGVDPSRLGALGVSFGASEAIQAAGMDSRIKATVAAVAFGDGRRWLRDMRPFWEFRQLEDRIARDRVQRARTGESEIVEHGVVLVRDPESARWQAEMVKKFPERNFKLPLETAEKIMEFRPERYVPDIAPRALMLVAASLDAIVDPAELTRMYEMASEPKALYVLEGVEHHAIYSGDPLKRWVAEAVRFFDSHLK